MDELQDNLKGKLILALCVVAVVAVLIGALCLKVYKSTREKYQSEIQELQDKVAELSEPTAVYERASEQVVIGIVNTEIKSIGELATLEYFYTDAGKYSDPKELFGHSIPFTTKSFIARWEGTIKAGIDISEITTEVDEENGIITVYMPEAKILSHELDENSFETLDQKEGLFNKIEVDDVRNFDKESKAMMEQRAIDNGILEKAYDSAKIVIEGLLNTKPEISKD